MPFDLELRKEQNVKMSAWKGSPVTMGRVHFKLPRPCHWLVFIEKELEVGRTDLYIPTVKATGKDSGSAFFGE